MIYDCAIVGGGASGILCAVELLSGDNKLNGDKIVILEKNDRIGKKLIATGNGQGNLSNATLSRDNYHGDKSFIDAFLSKEKEIDTEKYFYNLGIPFLTDKDGKKYPVSKQASAVLDILKNILDYNKVLIKTSFSVNKIEKEKGLFAVSDGKETILAKKLVISCGGKSSPHFGTDGNGYYLLTAIGHKLTKLYPSIVQVKADLKAIKGLSGLKEKAIVSAIVDGEKIKESKGDLLFTDYGLSGNTIFTLSSVLTDKENASVKIEFLPEFSEIEIEKIISDRLKNNGYIQKEDILCGIINKKIGKAVLSQVKDFSATNIAKALKNFTVKITGTMGFNNAQTTKGGINTDDVNPFTMKSKLIDGLYLTGEILNVDGDCGGYNLTFAFITGILAGKDVKNNL